MLGSQHHDLATIRNECGARQIQKQPMLNHAGYRLELGGQLVSVPDKSKIAVEKLILLIGQVRPIGPRFVYSQ
jgi:hypothetical protein